MDENDLREELLAVLAAHRELDGTVDEELIAGLLEKLAHRAPQRGFYWDVKGAYHEHIPVNPSTVAAIAAAQGLTLLVLGEYMFKQVLGFHPFTDGYAQAWLTFALIWVVEVIVTVAIIAFREPWRGGVRHDDLVALP